MASKPEPVMLQGQRIWTASGNCNIKYDPAWSPTKPYCTYYHGTAGTTFAYLNYAKRYIDPRGVCTWTDPG